MKPLKQIVIVSEIIYETSRTHRNLKGWLLSTDDSTKLTP